MMKVIYILFFSLIISFVTYLILRNHPVATIFFSFFVNVLTVLTLVLKDVDFPPLLGDKVIAHV